MGPGRPRLWARTEGEAAFPGSQGLLRAGGGAGNDSWCGLTRLSSLWSPFLKLSSSFLSSALLSSFLPAEDPHLVFLWPGNFLPVT